MTTSGKYILVDKTAVLEPDLFKWAQWMEDNDKTTHRTRSHKINVTVSTVFLGLDFGFAFQRSTPILFETMVLGGAYDGAIQRYSTYEDAEQGHMSICLTVFKDCDELERVK